MPKKGILAWPRLLRLQFKTALRGSLRYLFGKRGQRRIQGMRMYYRMQANFVLRTGGSLRSLASDREVRLWIDGHEAFERIETLIARSTVSIMIQMFIWKDDQTGRRMAKWLLDAADRGVTIEVMKEAVGDFFESYSDFLGTKDSSDPLWRVFWNHPRIRISHATNHDHAKVYVFDGHTLILGGMNVADEYRYDWHDCMVELRGSSFVEQFLTRKKPADEHTAIRLVSNTEESKDIRPTFVRMLDGAREQVVIEHAYMSDPEVVVQLVALSKRGVRITIILPQRMQLHNHATQLAIGQLMSDGNLANIRVFIFPGYCHSKIVLVDSQTAFLGSANLYKGSLDEMGEVNVLIKGRFRALWTLKEMLRQDVLVSKPLSSPPGFLWISRWLSWLGL
jgi:cardiolipin synthase